MFHVEHGRVDAPGSGSPVVPTGTVRVARSRCSTWNTLGAGWLRVGKSLTSAAVPARMAPAAAAGATGVPRRGAAVGSVVSAASAAGARPERTCPCDGEEAVGE